RVRGRPAAVAGLLIVVAAAFGLSRIPTLISPAAQGLPPLWDLPGGLAVGLVMLAVGAFLAERLPGRRAIGIVTALPGAWVVATHADLPDIRWIRVLTGVAIVA